MNAHPCPVCGILTTNFKYCSHQCHWKSIEVQAHPCIVCGTLTKNKKYCSLKCYGRVGKQELHPCAECNTLTTNKKYCSLKCYWEARGGLQLRPCIICGTLTANVKYCSHKCHGKDPQQLKRLHSEENLQKAFAAMNVRPNHPEQKLIDLIEKYKLPWKYVGDGQVMLGGKFPDFINTNGRKAVLEVFGDHWHDIFDIARKTYHYQQYGFDCLIIWEDELKDESRLLDKLTNF